MKRYEIKFMEFDQSKDEFIGMADDLEVWRNHDKTYCYGHGDDTPVFGYVLCDPEKYMERVNRGVPTFSGFIIENGNIVMTQTYVEMGMNRLVEVYVLLAAKGLLPSPVTNA